MKLYIKYHPSRITQDEARFIIADKNYKEFRLLEKDERVLEIKESNRIELCAAFSREDLIDMLISFNK